MRRSQRLIAATVLIALSAAGFVAFADWEGWLKVAVGIWLIAAPWLLGFAHTPAMHVSIVIGVIVTFLTLLEIWLAHDSYGIGAAAYNYFC